MKITINNFIKTLVVCGFIINSTFSQEQPPIPEDDVNWISAISYDLSGQTLSKNVRYFNVLGKPTQSQSWDILTNKVWTSEILYDYQGRSALQTLSAPVNSNGSFGLVYNFIQDNSFSGTYNYQDFDSGTFIDNPKQVNSSSHLGSYYWNNSTESYQDNTNYPFSRTVFSKLNPGNTKKVLGGNEMDGEWKQTYSFTMPAGKELSSLIAFNESTYDDWDILKTVSRDVHGIETVVFIDNDGNTLAAARSGNEEGDNDVTGWNNEIIMNEQGWVDFHIPQGCSTSVNLLNRSTSTGGGTTGGGGSGSTGDGWYGDCSNTSLTYVLIEADSGFDECNYLYRSQVYVAKVSNQSKPEQQKVTDFENILMARESSSDTSLPQGIYYKIYDLITEEVIDNVEAGATYTLTQEGFYRIELRFGVVIQSSILSTPYHLSFSYTEQPALFNFNNKEYGVAHCQNYYDYSLNTYDKTGRLLESTQPKSKSMKSEFIYNSLGQLQKTISPDEGEAFFLYRKDGQIRFSQNSKQKVNDEFSYTNYDMLGRPIESGVYRGDDILFNITGITDVNLFVDDMETEPFTVLDITPVSVQVVDLTYADSRIYFKKPSIVVDWGSSFASEESIDDDGKLEFSYHFEGGQGSQEYNVMTGFTQPEYGSATELDNGFPIKYGINLVSETLPSPQFGNEVSNIYIYENGDFIRDGNNIKISYGQFSTSDVFKLERINGIVTYYRNDTQLYTSTDGGYNNPLILKSFFKKTNNGISNLDLTRINSIVIPTNSAINTETLVDVQDGLEDINCFEQNFIVYDIPDPELAIELGNCGLPTKAYQQTFLSGNISKTFTKSPKTNITWYSYDVYGRIKWILQKTPGLDCVKTIDYDYDPISGLVVKVDYQRFSKTERFVHKYKYNIAGQLVEVWTTTDPLPASGEENYTQQAHYIYNEAGQLARTELAENLQGIDYVYNLNGRLKAINHPSLNPENDPGNDGNNTFMGDVFGMVLKYYDGDYLRTNTPTPLVSIASQTANQFNGNIQAIQWQNQDGGVATYSYGYNKNNWMQEALFNSSSTAMGDYNVDNITYDSNGNLLTLNRNGHSDSGTNAMDNFTYNYYRDSNQLEHVEDSNDNPDDARYNDLKNQNEDNYVYNTIGQLVINKQDNISYEYTATGLVSKIAEFSDTPTTNFSTLVFEDFESFDCRFYNMNFSRVALQRTVRANQLDGVDNYDDGICLGGIIEDNGQTTTPAIPEYCPDFDAENNSFVSRRQFNFYWGTPVELFGTEPGPFNISSSLGTIPNAYHELDFDLFMLLKQRGFVLEGDANGDIPITVNAVITLVNQDGSILDTITIDSQTITPSHCDRALQHINFNFTPTGNAVTLVVDITNQGGQEAPVPSSPSERSYDRLYQSIELDNFHLKVAKNEKLAFFYNDRGHRLSKETYDTLGNTYKTIYIRDASGNVISIYRRADGPTLREATTQKEVPVYGVDRIGVYYNHGITGNGNTGTYAYQLTDHLGNVRAVVMKNGTNALSLTNKTDYYPGGMAMPNRNIVSDYRYNYQGQELDPETGKVAFELRLYDPRINRWLTTDPAGQYHSPYMSMGNNWISQVDPDGAKADDYFDKKTGEYLGRGGTDDIRFISREDWDAGNLDNFTTFASANIEVKVLEHYADVFNIKSQLNRKNIDVEFNPSSGWSQSPPVERNGRTVLTTNFDKGDLGSLVKNRWDVYSIFRHETIGHGNDWLAGIPYDYNDSQTFWSWEKRATHSQIHSKHWPKTSPGFKQWIYDSYGKQPFVLPVNQRQQYFGKYNGVKID